MIAMKRKLLTIVLCICMITVSMVSCMKGEQGPKGDKGRQGENGADGKSAYEYAVDAGFTGTEEEFAELMKATASDFSPAAFLPDEIVCAVGRTVEIYNEQVCPLAEKYHFRWVCQIGKALERKFSITGTEALVGEHSLELYIYNDANRQIYYKKANLKIVPNAISDNLEICAIGDSLTNNKYWMKEVNTLSGGKIGYVGSRSGNIEGLTVGHEGRSGWTSFNMLAATEYTYENEGVHPFWDGEKFSWNYYKQTTGIDPDAVQLFFGTNELSWESAEVYAANMKAIVDAIRADDADLPIFVVLLPLMGDQNGIGVQQSNDGYASQVGKYKYGQDLLFIGGAEALYEALKGYEDLYFIPLTQCHDSKYNYGAVETPVNPRAEQTEIMPKEGVHPTKQGYEQFADVMFSVYCEAFNK